MLLDWALTELQRIAIKSKNCPALLIVKWLRRLKSSTDYCQVVRVICLQRKETTKPRSTLEERRSYTTRTNLCPQVTSGLSLPKTVNWCLRIPEYLDLHRVVTLSQHWSSCLKWSRNTKLAKWLSGMTMYYSRKDGNVPKRTSYECDCVELPPIRP